MHSAPFAGQPAADVASAARRPPLASRNSVFRIRAAVTAARRLIASEAHFRPRSGRVGRFVACVACFRPRGARSRASSRALGDGASRGSCTTDTDVAMRARVRLMCSPMRASVIGCCACASPVSDGSHGVAYHACTRRDHDVRVHLRPDPTSSSRNGASLPAYDHREAPHQARARMLEKIDRHVGGRNFRRVVEGNEARRNWSKINSRAICSALDHQFARPVPRRSGAGRRAASRSEKEFAT